MLFRSDRSIDDPLEFVMDNVVGTCNLLNYAKDLRVKPYFYYFSTDEVFGPAPESVNYDEYDRYNSGNPYSASKAGGEELAVAFRNTYNLPVVITHTMNVFGPRQHPEKFIPNTIHKVRTGETVTVHADSTKTQAGSRFYIHAEDVADALLFIDRKHEDQYLRRNGVDKCGVPIASHCPKYNIVGSQEIDNLQLAQLIATCLQQPLKFEMVDFHSSRPGHDLRYALSGERLKQLGWKPKRLGNR